MASSQLFLLEDVTSRIFVMVIDSLVKNELYKFLMYRLD